MPFDKLMSKSSLKSLTNIFQKRDPKTLFFLPKMPRPSASSKQVFLTHLYPAPADSQQWFRVTGPPFFFLLPPIASVVVTLLRRLRSFGQMPYCTTGSFIYVEAFSRAACTTWPLNPRRTLLEHSYLYFGVSPEDRVASSIWAVTMSENKPG